MLAELKVKCLSLGAESRIIKDQYKQWQRRAQRGRDRFAKAEAAKADAKKLEAIALGATRADGTAESLRKHRGEVRWEARSAHIAYCFLRGTQYQQIESAAYSAPDWGRIEEIARKFGGIKKGDNFEKFAEFRRDGENWLVVTEKGRQEGSFHDRRKPRPKPTEPRKRRTREEWENATGPASLA